MTALNPFYTAALLILDRAMPQYIQTTPQRLPPELGAANFGVQPREQTLLSLPPLTH
jgi:hypothetical protein